MDSLGWNAEILNSVDQRASHRPSQIHPGTATYSSIAWSVWASTAIAFLPF